ncbi:MAG TPA: glycine cleavage system protein R [Desulfobacterales bacterium]
MDTRIIVTITGPELPGRVKELAKITTDAGGRWSNLKLIHLEGQSACIFKVEIAGEKAAALKQALAADKTYQVTFAEPPAKPQTESIMRLVVDAVDRPGLVQDISHQLMDLGIEIDELDSHSLGTFQVGAMFTGTFTLKVPIELSKRMIVEKLEELSDKMKITLDPVETPEAGSDPPQSPQEA